ncbi:PDR/VanB family oxidoreductase [Streptomyces chiangmaiensis]|uniref:PDR/VanB family oxidoreductase n=1 Tax=Streptomyces chiangmaiensis TaxID=766497 RepID=A0ABU7FMJ1_9ACTN|nr:PDR/VanB family oxidoreductase [Streptomyces chiangmaiensis]MED7825268.1 PDR/VanB family oxidoreductase [Streptomyces chiangmaiensis]
MTDGTDTQRIRVAVADRRQAADDIVLLRLEPVDGGVLPDWEPGAHLDLHLPSGLTRQYSLCGDPRDTRSYTVCVQCEHQGRGGSLEVHRALQPGAELFVRAPRNHFPLVEAISFVFIAGGIGVTPIKAMVDEAQRRGTRWNLVYGGRSRGAMAFADELGAHGSGRVRLVPQDEEGLIDVTGLVAGVPEGAHVFCCGPAGLMAAVIEACAAAGLSDRLHLERFTAAEDPQAAPDDGTADAEFEVEMRASGVTVQVGAGQSILEVVRTVRDDVDFSCQEGYCGTCETKVLGGTPEHRGSLMSPEEHDAEGTMLICVGRSRSDRLVLDL